jgi:hypothetical protein
MCLASRPGGQPTPGVCAVAALFRAGSGGHRGLPVEIRVLVADAVAMAEGCFSPRLADGEAAASTSPLAQTSSMAACDYLKLMNQLRGLKCRAKD